MNESPIGYLCQGTIMNRQINHFKKEVKLSKKVNMTI